VLVATEELDGNGTFERTVILLLSLGSRDAYDGPFGIILNRPLYTKMKHVNPSFGAQLRGLVTQVGALRWCGCLVRTLGLSPWCALAGLPVPSW